MTHKLEVRIIEQLGNIAAARCEEVVYAKYLMAVI